MIWRIIEYFVIGLMCLCPAALAYFSVYMFKLKLEVMQKILDL